MTPHTASRPYKLITTDDPDLTLAQGRKHHYPNALAMCNAFARSDAAYKACIYDDGCEARELNEREQRLLTRVCDLLGMDIEYEQ
jgi:hypothetical protein